MSTAEPVSVTVKPLEWVEIVPRHFRAETIVGVYDIIGVEANLNYRLYLGISAIFPAKNHYWPLEAAKAAAQADYETRIRSALAMNTHEPLCWVYEDDLPESLTTEAYNALFPHSKVDGVRLFPVFGPAFAVLSHVQAPDDAVGEPVAYRWKYKKDTWRKAHGNLNDALNAAKRRYTDAEAECDEWQKRCEKAEAAYAALHKDCNNHYERAELAERQRDEAMKAISELLPLIPSYGYGVPEREKQRLAIRAARNAMGEPE